MQYFKSIINFLYKKYLSKPIIISFFIAIILSISKFINKLAIKLIKFTKKNKIIFQKFLTNVLKNVEIVKFYNIVKCFLLAGKKIW